MFTTLGFWMFCIFVLIEMFCLLLWVFKWIECINNTLEYLFIIHILSGVPFVFDGFLW